MSGGGIISIQIYDVIWVERGVKQGAAYYICMTSVKAISCKKVIKVLCRSRLE